MYTNIWAKYLPVIRIILKRSLASEQVLALNASDFQKVGLARKSGYKFSICFKNGRIDNVIIDHPLASSLATTLLQDPMVKELFAENAFQLTLSPKFQLTVKHLEEVATVKEDDSEESEA